MTETQRFTNRADAYVAARPSYPPESVDCIIGGLGDPVTLSVADLGAGTGISARVIAECGPLVYAIEPNEAMRKKAAPDPRIHWVGGTAEATTLPAASIDVVAAFQAWHWVDHPVAVAEARRILKPHGRLAAVYNERDERDAFTAAYGDVVRKYATEATEQLRADALSAFEAIDRAHLERFEFVNIHVLDRPGVHMRADSSSYLPHEGLAHDAMHVEIDALCDRFARPDGNFDMHLVTIVARVDV